VKACKTHAKVWMPDCERDSFLNEVMEEVDDKLDQPANKYMLSETPRLFDTAARIIPFINNVAQEFHWQTLVWSPVLQRTSDINGGMPIDWER
jgi:hypothetical protein